MLKINPYVRLFLVSFIFLLCRHSNAEAPQTTAEKSDYKKTSTHVEVREFCAELAKQSKLVRVLKFGTSHDGAEQPVMIIADPPIETPEEAAKSKKLVVFIGANVHAGEVDGKEAVLMLARDLALGDDRKLLKNLIVAIVPDLNPDGNDNFSKNRPEQNGPELVGTRENAQNLDLNRDYTKLKTAEIRSVVRFVNKWDPAIIVDCHTTNGSFHQYTLTYEGGRSPIGDSRITDYLRDKMLPKIGEEMLETKGYRNWWYGSFANDRTEWQPANPNPRYGTHYFSARNRIAILSESYTYASYKDRVLASHAFTKGILKYAAENQPAIEKLLADARSGSETENPSTDVKPLNKKVSKKSASNDESKPDKKMEFASKLVLRHDRAPIGEQHKVLGYVEKKVDGKTVPTDDPQEYPVQYMGGTKATRSVDLPYAYLFPPEFKPVIANLQRHGIEVDELREDLELDVEIYKITIIEKQEPYQKQIPLTLTAESRKEKRMIKAGTMIVRTSQPLGRLAAYLLEPMATDGLAAWNFFDAAIGEEKDFPVLRLNDKTPLRTIKLRANEKLPMGDHEHQGSKNQGEKQTTSKKPITLDAILDNKINLNGTPVSGLQWLDDSVHYLEFKEGQYYKVHAESGRATPFFEQEKLIKSFAAIPTIQQDTATDFGKSPHLRFDPAKHGVLVDYQNDLYFAWLDGKPGVRLTHTEGHEELTTFSPDGKFVAFVRESNLYVVDLATQTERALTTDGSKVISNGKADWVYFEEIFDRHNQAFWWSPDSTRIAFMRYDDTPVKNFTILNPTVNRQVPEVNAYPVAGQANPLVSVGVVNVAGGKVDFVSLDDYTPTSILVTDAGWWPDNKSIYFYVQDRAQTWLDICAYDIEKSEVKKLLRETTKAWVEQPGALAMLKDGSFLLTSERSGWKHLYHYSRNGKLIDQVTEGEWEVRDFHGITEASQTEKDGWIYFNATYETSIATKLYRVKLSGGKVEQLTAESGNHQVQLNPSKTMFIDSWNSHAAPAKVALKKIDGKKLRTLDTNPVPEIDDYVRGKFEQIKIPMKDGFVLEGSILKPANFDAQKKYPVWFMTYGGPHIPTVYDTWQNGRTRDEMLAQLGFIVFRCDPRSGSGKGAISVWPIYKQMGVQEMSDITEAIAWLKKEHPYVDETRIGMSGHSYGGYMTAYAMTHTKLFAAGIAGAPVTDFRNYDTIYTERYMNTPQENPKGYEGTNLNRVAGQLHGKLLLVHGLMDDNVHTLNSWEFVDALEKANKDFELMVYPHSRHGIISKHYSRLQVEFMKRALQPIPE